MRAPKLLAWIWRDGRYACRRLGRSPLFACVAISSLSLGLGANTAIYSFLHAILLDRLPVYEPERLVAFTQAYGPETRGVVWTLGVVDEFNERSNAFDGVFGWWSRPVRLSSGGPARWVNGELVTGEYYRTLRVEPTVGRLLDGGDVRNAAAAPVCVISYDFWQREFAGDPAAVGQLLTLNGRGYRIIGVTARGFHGAEMNRRFDIAVPATRVGDFMPSFDGPSGAERRRSMSWLVPMGRLGSGVTKSEAERDARLVSREMGRRQVELLLVDGSQGINTIEPEFGRPLLAARGESRGSGLVPARSHPVH